MFYLYMIVWENFGFGFKWEDNGMLMVDVNEWVEEVVMMFEIE